MNWLFSSSGGLRLFGDHPEGGHLVSGFISRLRARGYIARIAPDEPRPRPPQAEDHDAELDNLRRMIAEITHE